MMSTFCNICGVILGLPSRTVSNGLMIPVRLEKFHVVSSDINLRKYTVRSSNDQFPDVRRRVVTTNHSLSHNNVRM